MLHFFDLADKLRIEKNKQDQHKASKSLDNRSIGSMESLQIDTGDHNSSQQNSHHFRKTFSVFRKGLNSITPTSTSSSSSTGSHKKVTKKRSSHFSKKLMSFGSRHHHHASENGDSDSDSDGDFSSLSPVDSIASFVGAPSLPQQSSTHNQSHHNGSGMGKIQLFSAKSNSSGSNSSTTSSSRGHMNLLTSLSNSALSPGATKNARNAVTGTGTYTMMARKKPFFQNMRADHSTINQNQLTLPEFLTGLRKNSPAVRSAVENLLLVSEQDLPFVPDSVESIITLFDIVIGLYRLVLSDIENTNKYVTQTELNDLELLVASIEIILRRTVISESLIGLDSEYIKRTSFAQCRDAIEQDIIRACSQPNAIAPTKRSTVPSIKVV